MHPEVLLPRYKNLSPKGLKVAIQLDSKDEKKL